MKIAMMVRGFLSTPVPDNVAYSPATIAKSVAEGLTELGHEVTFYGPDGTNLKVTNVETCSQRATVHTQQEMDDFAGTPDLFSDYLPGLYDSRMARHMLEQARAGEFDCVIFNHFESALSIASLFPSVPIVYIVHDFIDDTRREIIEANLSTNQHFVSISDSQRRDAPDLPYADTVYNGIDVDEFDFENDAEDYLMFSGRITPDKGVKEAVQVAMQAGKRLLIAGSLSKTDYWYFDEYVKPFLNDRILYLGMLDKEQLIKYYKKAAGLLMPIQWNEPFGLSMAEANACGTPVIAFRRGSVSEVVVDGKTGFIVDNSAEMIMAIDKIGTIKRKDCREHIEKNFTRNIMINRYDSVLKSIVNNKTKLIPETIGSRDDKLKQRFKKMSRRIISNDPRSW